MRYEFNEEFSFSGSIYDRTEVEFNENESKILFIDYNWSSDSQSFVPNYKQESTYDDNGNRTLFIGYNWSSQSQSFVSNGKQEYTYMRMEIKFCS